MDVLESKNDEFCVLLEKLTKAVTFKYPGSSAPSVIVSCLPNGKFYASIVRYDGGHKQVMHNTTADNMKQVVEKLTNMFLGVVSPPNDPVLELKQHLLAKNDVPAPVLNMNGTGLTFGNRVIDGYAF